MVEYMRNADEMGELLLRSPDGSIFQIRVDDTGKMMISRK